MIKIALCDGDAMQLAHMEALLQDYRLHRPGTDLTSASFSSAIALLEHLRLKNTFDLYFLDVIMPGADGIELGLNIREFDQGGHIVYLAFSPDFAVDSYRARASGYLIKPLEKNRLFQVLDEILERLARERCAFLTVKTQDGFRRLPLRSIVYGELAGRRIQYHLTDGSVVKGMSLRGSFQDAVRPLLAHRRFVLCTASFFVNLAFVEVAGPSSLKLTGGSALPLSRALRAEVTSRWMDYCFGEEPLNA